MRMRKAYIKDAGALARLAMCLWPEHDEAEMEHAFGELLDGKEAACFLAEENGVGIGFAQCQLRHDYVEGAVNSPVGYLEGIYVAEDHRGKCVAAALLQACESWAKEMGCTEFASDCALSNIASQSFHEKLGFTEANRIVCYIKNL